MNNFLLSSCLILFIICYCDAASKYANYDKSINLFSPNGELLQVAYAEVAGDRGATAVCVPTNEDSIIVCIESDSNFDILLDKRPIDKICKIEDNIWLTFSGFAGDGRSLIRQAREFCGRYRMTYGSSASIESVANFIGEKQHEATLEGGNSLLLHQIIKILFTKSI